MSWRRWKKQGGGAIVNVASIAGLSAVYNKPSYTASKHGVIGMTKAAALQYARREYPDQRHVPGRRRYADHRVENHGGDMAFIAWRK